MFLNENKKITIMISSLAGGGAEGVCVNISNALSENGWLVTLVTLHLDNSVYHKRLNKKVKLVVLGVSHARYALFPLLNFIRNKRPKKILIFNYELAVLMVIIRTILPQKIFITARNINTLTHVLKKNNNFWLDKIVQPLIRWLYCKVDHVVNQSKGMQEDLLSFYHLSPDKISCIHNPVSKIIEDAAFNKDLSKVKKEKFFLCVGRLEEQKAFHYAIYAFSLISKDFPDFYLKIVGQGKDESKLKAYVNYLELEDRVYFEGFQKDMIPYYLKARATVLTSLYEGFPNVLIESIALGTPVLAFNCKSGPSEIIINGVNGFLVPYQDTVSLSICMKKIIETPLKTKDIIKTSKKYYLSEILNQYEKLFL